jgi:hypothetical protein
VSRSEGIFLRKMSFIYVGIASLIIATILYSLPIKQNRSTTQPDPDFNKVKSLDIEKVTIYEYGQVKVINKNKKDFTALSDGLRIPVVYSGLFDKSKDGKNVFRLPSLYVPDLEDLINGKANGDYVPTVIVVELVTPIDILFANNVAGLPNQFTKLAFLPLDAQYKKLIIFANDKNSCITIPTRPYNPDLFKDLF